MRYPSILALLPLLVVSCLAAAAEAKGEPRLSGEARVGKDPLIVILTRVDSLMSPVDKIIDMAARVDGSLTPEKIESGFAEIDEKLGFSLRDDLLEQLGPEFGLVIDIEELDTAVEQAAGFPGTASELLSNTGLFAQVRDAEKVDLSLRALALSEEGVEIFHDGSGLVRVRFSPQAEIVYGIQDGWLALGMNADWVRTTLSGRAEGQRLAEGEDYKRVMSNLDTNPDLIAYVNLPELLTLVQGSNMLKMMLGANDEARGIMELFATEEYLGMGWGHTSTDVDGGTRSSSFGPEAFSGPTMYAGIIAAVAIPNLLNAIDRGKQKRSMADLQSIGTAIESFSIDNDHYPTTDGWQDIDAVAELLEPFYIRTLPRVDGWGHRFRIHADGGTYFVVSAGKDGEVDKEWTTDVKSGPTTSFNTDIVFSDGQFRRWPEGTRQ